MFLVLLVLLAAASTSCGGEKAAPSTAATKSPPAAEPSQVAPAATPAAKPYDGPRGPIDPTRTGTITGHVRFDGEAPPRKELSIGGTGGCPEHPAPVFEESAIVANGRLANVFVHVKDGLDGWDLPALAAEPCEMNQEGCLYLPHVLGMRTGQTLLVRNSDTQTTHNVNIRSRSNESLNPVQAPGGKPIEWTPKKREVGVSFECNLHPWMRAWVCVVDQPWFAVSGADGSFSLAGLPPGEYVLEAWHEKFGKKTLKVALQPGGSAEATFAYGPGDKGR
jgi:hypothetical protein